MPRRPTRTVPTVIVPGWRGSGPEHWQSWLTAQLQAADREVRVPELPDLDNPSLQPWLAALRACLAGLPDTDYDVVAHSLGAVLWLHHVATPNDSPRAARVALVAPPAPHTSIPEIASFFPPPLDIDTLRHSAEGTVLVGGSDDPYLPEGIALEYGRPLKTATTVIEGGGHLSEESGYGEWPAVLDWCGRDNLAFY
ncbi:MAG: alpha/beta hydrolase [Jatrophihabitantaceae bacterium]